MENVNPNLLRAEYAVRGELVLKSMEHAKTLKQPGRGGLPFEKLVACNIGNPQALGQKPMTFSRQVLSLVRSYDEGYAATVPEDVNERAQLLLENIPGGIGAYSESKGATYLRQTISDFIERRDGHPSDPDNIFMTDGASPAVHMAINTLIRDRNDGILVPIPQYPLYSACIALYGGTLVPYYLDEANDWALNTSEVVRALEEARKKGINVRGIAVINPGNPVGNVMAEDNIKEIVDLCAKEQLVVMADEVYQDNIWDDNRSFHSFKKVMRDMGDAANGLQLASFHSISKGFTGECGMRGGYMEVANFDEEVKDQMYKYQSICLCSNLMGQVAVSLMTNPPKPGDPSYPLYADERDGILRSLKRRSIRLVEAYNKMEGVTCNKSQGALYTFPQVRLPQKAIEAAHAAGKQPDTFYCLQMLDATGVIVVPGSGFGQEPGTWHYRSTILPPEEDIDEVVERSAKFHAEFMDRYSD